jgi:hypothetical protein
MGRGMSMFAILAALLELSAGPQQAGPAPQSGESQVVPLKKIPPSGMDKRFETVSGDPRKAGAPFVIRIHAEAGYIIMPHRHPIDENIVVVKGSWALGMGDRFNREGLEPMEVGDYGFVSNKMAHFALSKTYTIVQVHGIGPFLTQWIAPVYELTDKGVLRKTGAEDPGRPTPTSPDGCFDLKLGTAVRGSAGEGVVVRAQCTPGELTQYRIETPDGERFWAQRDELKTQ